MTTRSTFIANRLREVLLNGTWIANTNFKDQIENLTFQEAIHQVGNLNSIAALTFHINYYLDGILNVFKGGGLEIRDAYSFDLPPMESDSDWEQLKQLFYANAESFVNRVAQFDESIWDEDFVDPKYGTYLRNIEGVIEHSYYHLGQVVLIKKMIRSNVAI